MYFIVDNRVDYVAQDPSLIRGAIFDRDRMYYRARVLLFLFVALLTGPTGCATDSSFSEYNKLQVEGTTMGTYFRITYWAKPGFDEISLDESIQQIFHNVNQMMSNWNPSSEVSQFNNHRSKNWYPVSDQVVQLVTQSKKMSELSGGAFDITAGALIGAWGFGPGEERRIPDPQDVTKALQSVGYLKLESRSEPPGLKKLEPEMGLNFSAIAKGFAIDRIAVLLESKSISHYLIDIGGDMLANGGYPDGSAWEIALEFPDFVGLNVYKVFSVTTSAIASSGNYRNFFEQDGETYSHILDPRSGKPVSHNLLSVTVFDATATQADALATTVMVLGPDAGLKLLNDQGKQGILLVRSEDSVVEIRTDRLEIPFQSLQ